MLKELINEARSSESAEKTTPSEQKSDNKAKSPDKESK